MNKNLLLIEQYFYPDGWSGTLYPLDIAEKMRSEGWNVKVICGDLPYKQGECSLNDPREKGISIEYIHLPFRKIN